MFIPTSISTTNVHEDLLQAIRLNPGDLGVDYQVTSGATLSPEAIKHGEEQVRKMLQDRPAMAEHVTEGDELWTWAVRKFAGEDGIGLIDWNPADPRPAFADWSWRTTGGNRFIRVNPDPPAVEAGDLFESLWSCAVFELHNAAADARFRPIEEDLQHDRLQRDEFICAMDWYRRIGGSKDAQRFTRDFSCGGCLPRSWRPTRRCGSAIGFGRRAIGRAHIAFWKTLPNWQYYSTWYDLNSADREYRAGHYERLRGILDGVSKQQDTLSQEQQSELHYWRGYLYWATGEPGFAAAEFKTVLSHDPERTDVK